MKVGGFIVVVVLAVLMTLGTLNELYFSGPWYLHWLDVRWWWHWIAVVYTWGSTIFNTPGFNGPESAIGKS